MIASSLFHFTGKIETVKDILTSFSFRASYRIENVEAFGFTKPYLAIPMVCFCDIPLKFVNTHSIAYGGYGIGLSKNWAIRKLVNPLHYLVESSLVTTKYKNLIHDSGELMAKASSSPKSIDVSSISFIQDSIVRLAAFTKAYETVDDKFYSEREWRFIPEISGMLFVDNDSNIFRAELNKKYHVSYPDFLEFTVDDIQHIIVPSPADIGRMIAEIYNLTIPERVKLQLVQKINDLITINNDY